MTTLADAKSYVAARFGPNYTSWSALSDADMNRTLVSATSLLDTFPWLGDATGVPAGDSTFTSWPRSGIDGVDPLKIPIDVVHAEFELAVLILAKPDLVNKIDQGSNISSVAGGGGVSVSYFAPTSAVIGTATVLPVIVTRLVAKYLALPSADGSFGAVGNPCSRFSQRNQFNLGWPED